MLMPASGIINHILKSLGISNYSINFLGEANTAMVTLIVMGTWRFAPFMIIMFLSRLQTISQELYDAARIVGANAWKEFWYVTIPWLSPTIIVATILRIMWTFKDFSTVYLLTKGGPVDATRTLPLFIYQLAFSNNNMGAAAAVSIMMLLIQMPIIIWYLRRYEMAEERITL